jgi:hypothetical protein
MLRPPVPPFLWYAGRAELRGTQPADPIGYVIGTAVCRDLDDDSADNKVQLAD